MRSLGCGTFSFVTAAEAATTVPRHDEIARPAPFVSNCGEQSARSGWTVGMGLLDGGEFKKSSQAPSLGVPGR